MNTADENHLKLIETIFSRFLVQTQSDNPQLSRDYFERFTQLLNQTFHKYPQLKSSIETIISSIIYPFHPSNNVTFEYQLRLIRFSLRQHLQLNKNDFLNKLFHHTLLIYSSIVRHLSLQIAILIYEHDLYQSFDDIFFSHIIKLFSPDPNLYVRNTLAQFLALYISKHDQYELLNQIQKQSLNSDLIYDILILLDQDKQQLLIKQLDIYGNLSDSTAIRAFVLKTSKYLIDEDNIVFYLNRILEKSLSDYVHMLLSIISSRYEYHRSNVKLTACLKALFLYIQETEIEEIDENEHNFNQEDEFGELTEYICCQLYERNIESIDLASIVLDAIQPFISDSNSFLYKLNFYSSMIIMMLTGDNHHDKNFAQLINCFGKLQELNLSKTNLNDVIIDHVKNKKRTTLVYQALFNLILNTTNRKSSLQSIYSIIDSLLFQDTDTLLQWDNKDCVLHFLIQLIKTSQSSEHEELPSWFTNEFLQRIIEKLVHDTNEYIQGSLIDFLSALVEYNLLSPLDNYLTSNFIQLTEYSLGDVVRCALAHAWYIILTKANEDHTIKTTEHNYRFSFGLNTNHDLLSTIVIAQIPLLIGDGGHETEIQCLNLIEFIGGKTKELETVLDFLINDGCSNEIKEKARRLLSISNDNITEEKNDEILEDELSSVLHWLEHPDEHMILDCD